MTEQPRPLTVSELTRKIKALLERGFSSFALTGEISNVHFHSSGHVYFTLKDEHSQISAVIWRSKAVFLKTQPADGLRVVVTGRLTVYEPRGVYQIEVSSIRPVGIGELSEMFEQLKRKLFSEGLFDPSRKKSLPPFPESIGIVTSPTGAVLHDMVSIINRRFPGIDLFLYPVRVQGPGAAGEISGAVHYFNQVHPVDVLILARGGGSLEDLWAFNEESLAREIGRSDIPVVSAVGHEVDFTIADFVADLRAPTPSAAAELVVPDRQVLLGNLRRNWYNLHESTASMLSRHRETIQGLIQSHTFHYPLTLLSHANQRVDELERSLRLSVGHRVGLLKASLVGTESRLHSLAPEAVLRRGYALVYDRGKPVSRAAEVGRGDTLDIRFQDGIVRSTVG
jgi:exodeoxyribonuclease VII large subunit